MSTIIVETINIPTEIETTIISASINEDSTSELIPSFQEITSLTAPSAAPESSIKTFVWSSENIVNGNIRQSQNPSSFKSRNITGGTISNDDKKHVQPLDIAEEWVNSEYDEDIHFAKNTFLTFAKRNLKKENYTIVYRGYDIIKYLSEGSQGFFRIIANHIDLKNAKIARLYEWKMKGSNIYILAIDDIDSPINNWLDDRRDFYNDVASKGQLEDGSFDKKSHSILRRNALKDFANKFTSTWFFKDFDTAKRAITMKVTGHVQFLKKDFKKDDEIDEEDDV